MRRGLAALSLGAALGCGGGRAASVPEVPLPPLHVDRVADLCQAAGLAWLVDVRPSEIAAHAELIAAIRLLVAEERFDAFAAHNGGLDLRTMKEIAIADYGKTTLYLARAPLDPGRVEAAFAEHLVTIEGRALDRKSTRPAAQIVRAWGTAQDGREQLAIFGVEAAALERGRLGPLRAAELFAEERLKKASPALRAVPLARVVELLGDAPVRAFAPGPFADEWGKGLGGLLAASTAVGLGVRIAPADPASAGARLDATLVLLGAWRNDAPAAMERLSAVFNTLADSALGRLVGLHEPLARPRVRATDEKDALLLDVSLDATLLAGGLRAATGASIAQIMSFGGGPRALTPGPK